MFSDLLDECVGLSDSGLDERIRENELALRALHAEQAALLSVSSARGAFRIDGHRSLNSYTRATCNVSSGEAARRRKVADACAACLELGDALTAGRIGLDQVLEIARIHTNPRTREFFGRAAPVYVEFAEHDSHARLKLRIDDFINTVDQDGSFAQLLFNIAERTASVNVLSGTLDVRVSGGDPLAATEFVAIFDMFLEAEFQSDVEARRAEHGDAADQFPLRRTDRQRRFDAMIAMARAGREHFATGKPTGAADVTINVVTDAHTLNDVFENAGLVATVDGRVAELDDDMIDGILDTVADDRESFVERRCETADGTAIHPTVLLQAALFGHIRRVLVDSQGVVIDRGRTTRLFTDEARAAAKLLFATCSQPGCSVKARYAQVDHIDEWHVGGRTDQRNSAIKCQAHNRDKHRERWRTRRDQHGRPFTIRPDGSIMLPVGARPPDLSIDEMNRAARDRLAALCCSLGVR